MKIKTITPIWTGGFERKADRIHETGLLGSMRWLYEMLVRGVGGKTCKFDNKCCDIDKLCHVCKIFGTTGWKRRFRIFVLEKDIKIQPDGIEGNFDIQIQGSVYINNIIKGIVQFAADWTSLGAKSQMGFGVIELLDGPYDTRPFYQQLSLISDNNYIDLCDLPSLRNCFFARIEDVEKDTIKKLKRELHRLFLGDKTSKVKISYLYDQRLIRLWGWIPGKNTWNRNKVLDAIYTHLNDNYKIQVWREMGSERDTIMKNNNEPLEFLESMLNKGEPMK